MPVYPLSLPRLAWSIEQAGHRTRQFDILAHGRGGLSSVLKDYHPDLIALSIRNIDNVDAGGCLTYIEGYAGLMETIRANSKASIALGGSGFSIFPVELMSRLGANFGIVGPGEEALVSLLDVVENGEPPRPKILGGNVHRYDSDGQVFSGALHQSDLVEYYWRTGGMIGVQSKRGCSGACSYCTYPSIDGGEARYASVSTLVDEMELLVHKMGVDYFFFVDSVFNQDSRRELALAEEILKRKLSIRWAAFFSPSGMDRKYLEVLKKSGLTHVEFGTESLSDRMLISYNKRFTVDEAMACSELSSGLGLHTAHYLLFGGPGEEPATVKETLSNARKLSNCVMFPFAGVRVYPGTGLFQQARSEGLVRDARDCFDPVFYFPQGFSGAEIWKIIRDETEGVRHWVYPSKYEEMAPVMRRLRMRGIKGPLWEFFLRS
jgi:radical SAM superfamily enzyme YgiQ (UPF0313 family)